jgi:hypothetical protein
MNSLRTSQVTTAIVKGAISIQFAILLLGCLASTSAVDPIYTTIKTDQFRIAIPGGWTVTRAPRTKEPFSLVLFVTKGVPVLSPSITVYASKHGEKSLAQFTEWITSEVHAYSDSYRTNSLDSRALNGENTLLRVSQYELESLLFPTKTEKCWENYRLHQESGYLLTFCAYEEDFAGVEPVFKHVLESFAFTN